jgi:hypothetical protein
MQRYRYLHLLCIAAAVAVLCSSILTPRSDMSAQAANPGSAQFNRGNTTWSGHLDVGPAGGTLAIDAHKRGFQQFSVHIPADAVQTETRFAVGFNDGAFKPVTGEASGTVVVIDSGAVRTFRQPVTITLQRDRATHKGVPVGFALDDNGKVRLLDLAFDRSSGKLTVYTFRPLTFTWVYARP